MAESSRPSIQIDLKEFKLHLHLKGRTHLTLHFNSPSRRFYPSVIVLLLTKGRNSPLWKRGVRGDFIGGKEDD